LYRSEKEKVERALAYLAAKNPGLGAHVSKYAIKKGLRRGGYAYFDYRDGSIVISEEWLRKVDHKGLAALLAHEALHGALGHWVYLKEGKVSHPLLWNLASDVEANSVIEELGLWDELHSATWKIAYSEPVSWRKLSYLGIGPSDPAELVYQKLLDKIKNNEIMITIEDQRGKREVHGGQGWDTVVVISDVVESVESEESRIKPKSELWGGDPEFRRQVQEGYERFKEGKRDALKDVASTALAELIGNLKVAGNVPAALERFVKPAKPQLPWNLILRQSLKDGSSFSERTWTVPNRRGLEYVPGYRGRASSVWLLVDTSGSISDDELSTFVAEVVAASRFGKVNLVVWDAQPYIITLTASKSRLLARLKGLKGGGGTLARPVLELVLKRSRPGEPVVVLTDGYWFDEDEVEEIMKKIKRKSGAALLVTTEYVPEPARRAGWRVLKVGRRGTTAP